MKESFTEKMRREALRRMKMLGLSSEMIEAFEKDGSIYYTDENGEAKPFNEQVSKQAYKAFAEYSHRSRNETIYYCIQTPTKFGELWSFLTVSEFPEDWPIERAGIPNGNLFAYVYNAENPVFSEIGSIVVEKIAETNVLVRVR